MRIHRRGKAASLCSMLAAVSILGVGGAALSGSAQPAGAVVPGAVWGSIVSPTPGTPVASPNTVLRATSCPASGECVAVGAFTNSDNQRQGVIDSETGPTWTPTQAPLPPADTNPGVTLDALDCPATGSCAAGGWFTDPSSNGQGLLEVLSSGSWTATTAPLPISPAPAANPETEIFGTSCSAQGACVAVGDYLNTDGVSEGLIETLAGGIWTPSVAPTASPPGPSGPNMTLTAVRCPAAGSCVAVGTYVPAGSPQQGIIVTITDGIAAAQNAPLPAGADASLGALLVAVSCPSSGSCVAAGIYNYYFKPGDPDHGNGLIDTLSGGTWSATEAPVPSDAPADPGVRINAVSCPATSFCALAGTYGERRAALLDTFSGGSWHVGVGQGLDTTGAQAAGVSCPAVQQCVAVGGSVFTAYIWTLTPRGWSAVPVPVPPGGRGFTYPGSAILTPFPVSCPVTGDCVAVGSYSDTQQNGFGFIDTLRTPPASDTYGYWLAAQDGGMFSFGRSNFYGSSAPSSQPVVGVAAVPDTQGYLEVTSGGAVYAFGSGQEDGSLGGKPLNAPIVGIAGHPSGGGYWLTGADGGVFTFGNASFFGSMGGKPLNAPITGIEPTPDGQGYWLVARDGGIFAFGDAKFRGSMGGKPLNAPVVGMSAAPNGNGYWLVARDGGIFAFDAPFLGSMGGKPLAAPVTSIAGI